MNPARFNEPPMKNIIDTLVTPRPFKSDLFSQSWLFVLWNVQLWRNVLTGAFKAVWHTQESLLFPVIHDENREMGELINWL